MKQYIKKALLIIPCVFSLNLSATKYYFLGTSSGTYLADPDNWNTQTNGLGSKPNNINGLTDFNSGSDEFDFYGASGLDFDMSIIGNAQFINSSSTAITVTNFGTLVIEGSPSFSTTNITYDFDNNSTTVIYSQSSAGQNILAHTYYDLTIINGTKNIPTGSTITVTHYLSSNQILTVNGTLVLSASSDYLGYNSSTALEIQLLNNGVITDNRSSKTYPGTFKHYASTNVLAATYNSLHIMSTTTLTGNTVIQNELFIGSGSGSTGTVYLLSCSSYELTLPKYTLSTRTTGFGASRTTTYSRINPQTGTIILNNTSPRTILANDFGTSSTASSTVDLNNLTLSGTSDILIVGNLTVNGNLTHNSGTITLSGSTLRINGTFTTKISSTTLFLTASGSTTHRIDLTSSANAKLILENTLSSGSFLSIGNGNILNNTLSNLELKLVGGGIVQLSSNLTISDNLNLNSTTGNILDLNGYTLTLNGSITNTNNTSGGKFKGSNSSNLICSTANVGTIYFDQSTASSYTLQNLTLANGASCTLGSNLILANGVDLGTSNLTIGSNTLTFAGSSATWITRNGGRINTTGGTIKYAQTSTAGTDHSIELAAYTSNTTGNLNNLTIDFANACTFTPPSNMTIDGTLNLSGTNNTFVLNGTTLTVSGSVTSNGGKFKGSSTSILNCSGTSSLYFDQTNASTKTLKKLHIQGNNASVTLANALNITGGTNYGSVEVTAASSTLTTGNNLTLKSDANGTARISNSPGTISGNYYAEQYFPANREYRFICAPVVGATALQWRNNGSTTSHTGLGISITGANPSSNSFDASTANKPSAFWYDETIAGSVTNVNSTGTDDPGWTSISNGNSYGLTNGKGFRVLVRGDRDISLSSSSPSPSTTTITSYGTYPRTSGSSVVLNVTNTNRTSETNNGLNLVGNPFPSAIDWNSISLSNVDNGYATYDPVGHKYVAWNGSLGDATRYISSGQAFFVMCTSSGTGTLTIEEADKYDGKGGNFFLEKLSNHMRINLMYDSTYNSDAFIHFRDDASDVKDVYDIQQFYVNGTNIASLDKNGKPYKINSLKTLDSLTVVPLSIAGTPEASLKLSFYDIPSFYGYKLELVDTYLKKTVEITEGMIYNLDITSDSFTVKDGRFYINIAKIPGLKNRSFESNKIANIYPNPIQDKMAIRLDKKITQANYEIFNSIGQLITKGNIKSPESTINTSSYSNGTYYLIVKTNNSSQTIQFVK